MKPVFADTGFWIALLYSKDRWHQEAIELYRSLQQQKRKVVTSDLVLTEFLNFFSKFDASLRQKAGLMVKQTRKKLGSKVTPRLFKAGRKNDAATLVAMTCYNSKALLQFKSKGNAGIWTRS